MLKTVSPRAEVLILATAAKIMSLLALISLGLVSGFFVVAHGRITIVLAIVFAFAALVLGSRWPRFIRTTSAFDSWVLIAFASLFVVKWEPAPFDLLISMLFVWGFLAKKVPTPKGGVTSLLITLMFLFSASQYLSALVSVSYAQSLFFGSVSVLMVVISVSCFVLGHNLSLLLRVLTAFTVGAFVSTFVILALVFSGLGAIFIRFGMRLTGLFKDPNVLAPYLVMAFIFALALSSPAISKANERVGKRVVILVALAILGVGVFLAYSRAGWVNLGISLLVFWALRSLETQKRTLQSVMALLVGLPLGVLLVSRIEVPADSLLGQRLQLQRYDESRFSTQLRGLEEFWHAPMLGHGPGMTGQLLNFDTHNTYIRLLFENGLLGFLPFMLLLGGSVALSFAGSLKASSAVQRNLSAAICATLIGASVSSFVIDSIHWRHLWVLIGLGWAVSAWLPRTQKETQDKMREVGASWPASKS